MDKKINLFFLLCIPLRLLLVYIAYILPLNKLKYMGYLMLIPSIGFGNSFLKYKKEKEIKEHLEEMFGGIIIG